jgi:hypothetical protein
MHLLFLFIALAMDKNKNVEDHFFSSLPKGHFIQDNEPSLEPLHRSTATLSRTCLGHYLV